uniref:Histone H2A n=1 Tax=Kalanchoe fedtschenkoi TaxID=63787 RepID=A0A7N0UVE8_KALFE
MEGQVHHRVSLLIQKGVGVDRKYVSDNIKTRIIPRHLLLAIRNDEELVKLLAGLNFQHQRLK